MLFDISRARSAAARKPCLFVWCRHRPRGHRHYVEAAWDHL